MLSGLDQLVKVLIHSLHDHMKKSRRRIVERLIDPNYRWMFWNDM